MFEEYAHEQTMRVIARNLTMNGIRTRRGGEWHESTIRAVLNNPSYTGEVEEHGVISRRGHEAIISTGLFQACQMRMEEKRLRERLRREMFPDEQGL